MEVSGVFRRHNESTSLGLRAGELVEVKSFDEILATLDEQGSLDGLPFMPEMLVFCGRRKRVVKRADKTCDTIDHKGGRAMTNAVHLEGIRCDGADHGGCQAGCLIFWKESWLKRVGDAPDEQSAAPAAQPERLPPSIARGARRPGSGAAETDIRYRCQTTELNRATTPLSWWDVRQYVRELMSGNITAGELVRGLGFAGFRKLIEIGVGYRVLVALYNRMQRYRRRPSFPLRNGTLQETPTARLDLQPGEWVRVKSHEEILATLDTNNKNRRLSFDVEMVRYCGGNFQVQGRVNRIIEEKTGRMLRINHPCIILRDVYCRGEMSKYRLFCPRAIHHYWREIWLERSDANIDSAG